MTQSKMKLVKKGPVAGDNPSLTFWQSTDPSMLPDSQVALLQFLHNIGIYISDRQEKKLNSFS